MDELKSRELNQRMVKSREEDRFERLESTGAINGSSGFSYLLLGYAAAQVPQSDNTDFTTFYLLGKQAKDGRWPSYSRRPPLEDTPVTLTAMALRGLKLYTPDYLRQDSEKAIRRGHQWLTQVRPKSTEESTMQMVGIYWSGLDRSLLPRLRASLLAQQRPNGGWAQISIGDTDAYATGQAYVALHLSGTPRTHPSLMKAAEYLRKTQLADGSWLVETRRRYPGLPYFESGFPHGKHQFISYAGTAWATMALTLSTTSGSMQALAATQVPKRKEPYGKLAKIAKDERLFAETLRGTVQGMETALRRGANVNGLSLGGATPLVYAVREPAKVRLLLKHGANPNFVTPTKTTPLMLAAEYVGQSESMDLLLKAGASLHQARDLYENVFSLAVSTGDQDRVKKLLALKPEPTQLMIGVATSLFGIDLPMLKMLLETGIDPNTLLLDKKETLLSFAVMDGLKDFTKLLLDKGANPNHVTMDGLSTLMVAAMCDHGGTEVVDALLWAGAKADYRSPDGKTALSLANKYKNDEIARAISSFGK